MSTYFDICCRDCKTEAGFNDTNRREETLLFVLQHRAFVEVCDAAFELRIEGLWIPVDFFREHKEHRLGVRCEYETLEQAEVRFEKGLTWDGYRILERQSSST